MYAFIAQRRDDETRIIVGGNDGEQGAMIYDFVTAIKSHLNGHIPLNFFDFAIYFVSGQWILWWYIDYDRPYFWWPADEMTLIRPWWLWKTILKDEAK